MVKWRLTCLFAQRIGAALRFCGQLVNNCLKLRIDLANRRSRYIIYTQSGIFLKLLTLAVSLWNTCSVANSVCKLVTKNNILES